MIRILVAIDRKRGIAKHGYQPWYIPDDEAYFARLSKSFGGNVLVGGVTFRNAFKSKPLENRNTYLLTHNPEPINGVHIVHDLGSWLNAMIDKDIWVVGGAAVYKEILEQNLADELYITHIEADFRCDQFFPEYEAGFSLINQSETKEQNGFHYNFSIYSRS